MTNKNKERINRTSVMRGQNSQINTLKAIEQKKYLHVWSLHSATSIDAVMDHVTSICNIK